MIRTTKPNANRFDDRGYNPAFSCLSRYCYPMRTINRFIEGFKLMPAGFSLIFRPGVKRFVAIPLLVNIILFGTAIWYGYRTLGSLIDRVTNWLPGWLDWLATLVWPLVAISALIVIYYSFTLLANLIAAPFNSLLAERIEASMTGNEPDQAMTFGRLPQIAARTIWSEIRKLLYQLKWLIALLLVSIIPGLNLLSPFAWFYFAAWMLSVNYVDYPMGNHDRYFRDVKQQLKADRMTALGMGCGLLLLTLIPVLNFLAMPVGVASGTAYYTKRVHRIDTT